MTEDYMAKDVDPAGILGFATPVITMSELLSTT